MVSYNTERELSINNKLEGLFQNLRDMLIVFNGAGRILMTNQATCDSLGYPFEMLMIKKIFSLHPPDRQGLAQELIKNINPKETIQYNIPFITSSGQILEIESKVGHSNWDHENIYFGIFRDVTQPRLANRRNEILIDCSNKLSDNKSDDIQDIVTRILADSARFFEAQRGYIYMYQPGATAISNGYEWTAEGGKSNFENIMSNPHTTSKVWLEILKSKNHIIIENLDDLHGLIAKAKPLYESNGIKSMIAASIFQKGELRGFIGVSNFHSLRKIKKEDINFLQLIGSLVVKTVDQVELYQSLKNSEKRLMYALQATEKAIWDFDVRNNRCQYSPQHYKILGYPQGTLEPTLDFFISLVHAEEKNMVRREIDEFAQGKTKSLKFEHRMRHYNGEWVWVKCTGIAVESDKNGLPLRAVGTHGDITTIKRQELQLKTENSILRQKTRENKTFCGIIGHGEVMRKVYDTLEQAAESDANVIICGESGTGKELAAHAIHKLSTRSTKPFVPVNCGAIPENILESEFFGYIKGAFSGASADKNGYLDSANGGTLFLDELGELPVAMQVKLLRVLEGSGYTPLGSSKVKTPNIRIVSATNRNLKELVEKGLMREDFYFRINVLPIQLPPLRERKEDIPHLIQHFLQKFSSSFKKSFVIDDTLYEKFYEYDWPGNVRELQNVIHRYLSIGRLDIGEFKKKTKSSSNTATSVIEKISVGNKNNIWNFNDAIAVFEKDLIINALKQTKGNKLKAAELLKMPRKTLYRKIDRFNIKIDVNAY